MRVLKRVNIERKHKCQFCRSIFAYEEKDVDRIVSVSMFDRKVRSKYGN